MLKNGAKNYALSILWLTYTLQKPKNGVNYMKPHLKEKVHAQLKVLGMRHSWEIIANIRKGTKYMKQIANETAIPYTTVQKRIHDMEQAGIVRVFSDVDHTTGKAIKKVRVSRFKINLDPYTIERALSDETRFINK